MKDVCRAEGMLMALSSWSRWTFNAPKCLAVVEPGS